MEENNQGLLPGAMDTGFPISTEEFRTLVSDYLRRMESGYEMTTEDYVTMIRLWNTIEFRRLGPRDSLFHRYAVAFFPAYVERISKSLNAQPTKGMALYSKEHDIYLGGKPHPRSQYKLEEEH
jgi:hypothetical protein